MSTCPSVMTRPLTPFESGGRGTLVAAISLPNEYSADGFLQSMLLRYLGKDKLSLIEKELIDLGHNAANKYFEMSETMEREKPKLIQYDAFGHRIDKLITCREWNEMKKIASKEGVVGIGYKTASNPFFKNNKNSNMDLRMFQFAKLHLWMPSSGLYSCPIAMTDGAAKLLHTLLNDQQKNGYLSNTVGLNNKQIDFINDTYLKLTNVYRSNNNNNNNSDNNIDSVFWTSGQWMTERGGGSDVSISGTQTIAVKQEPSNNKENEIFNYRLFGYKWFSSASDANIAIALARIEDHNNNNNNTSKTVSCFLVKVKEVDAKTGESKLNNINMARLKDKLGTRQLPTAELELNGAPAILISQAGKGVSTIMKLANITRIHNALSSSSAIRRSISFSRQFAKNRIVLGKNLTTFTLHKQTLITMEIIYRCTLLISFDCVKLLGQSEMSNNNESKKALLLLRLLTPLAKLYNGKAAVAMASEGIECLGGIGFLEDSGMPKVFRDSQVLPVWEGTTNVLSMDVLRVLTHKEYGNEAWTLYYQTIRNICDKCKDFKHSNQMTPLTDAIDLLTRYVKLYIFNSHHNKENSKIMVGLARDFSLSLARVYCGAQLIEHAMWSNDDSDWVVAISFVNGTMQGTWFGKTGLVASSIVQTVLNAANYESSNDETNVTRLMNPQIMNQIGLGVSKL